MNNTSSSSKEDTVHVNDDDDEKEKEKEPNCSSSNIDHHHTALTCPICLRGDDDDDDDDDNDENEEKEHIIFASGPCGHVFGMDCLERLLLFPSFQQQQQQQSSFSFSYSSALSASEQRRQRAVQNPPLQWIPSSAISSIPSATATTTSAMVTLPTLGACPICRSELCLFDLKRRYNNHKHNKNNHKHNHNSNDDNDWIYSQNPTNISTTCPALSDAIYVDATNLFSNHNRPLLWSRNRQHLQPLLQKAVGRGSFHFPSNNNNNNNSASDNSTSVNDSPPLQQQQQPTASTTSTATTTTTRIPVDAVPFCNWEQIVSDTAAANKLQINFDKFHYHAQSRTFSGKLLLSLPTLESINNDNNKDDNNRQQDEDNYYNNHDGDMQSSSSSTTTTTNTTTYYSLPFMNSSHFHLHVVLQFSADWRFIRQGVIIKRWKRYTNTTSSSSTTGTTSSSSSSSSTTTTTSNSLYDFWRDFPLDGKWIVTSCSTTLPAVTGTTSCRRLPFQNGQELLVTGGQCFRISNHTNEQDDHDKCIVYMVNSNLADKNMPQHYYVNSNSNHNNNENNIDDNNNNNDYDSNNNDQQWKHCRPVLLLAGRRDEPSHDSNNTNNNNNNNNDDSLMSMPFFPINPFSSSSSSTTTQLWAKDEVDLTLPKLQQNQQQNENSPSSSCKLLDETINDGRQITTLSDHVFSNATWTQNGKAIIQQHQQQQPQHFGIPVGGSLEWTFTQPPPPSSSSLNHAMDQVVVMTWKRISIAMSPPPDEVEYVGGNSGRHIVRLSPLLESSNSSNGSTTTENNTPTHCANGLWGNVFCQGLKVGLASYHFIDSGSDNNDNDNNNDNENHELRRREPRAYISYEHPATGQWPPLDNGAAVPPRVEFRNITMPNAHTFCASICWLTDFGTSWQGMVQWDYEMHFDTHYTCILSGHVHAYSQQNPHVPREFSRFGESLVYTNAALYEVFRNSSSTLTPTTHSTGNDSNNSSNVMLLSSQGASTSTTNTTSATSETAADNYRRASLDLRLRLQREGASVRTIALVHSILTAAMNPHGENPVDYNLY